MRQRRSLVIGVVLLALLAACQDDPVAGNSGGSTACPTTPSVPLGVVVGARANSAVPQLPDGLARQLNATADADQRIALVRLDGDPEPVFNEAPNFDAANGPTRDDQLNTFLSTVQAKFGEAKAVKPEADVLSALSLAGRSTAAHSTIVVLDSGLQTAAPLDFRKNDLLLAQPDDVVAFLRKQNLLPDLKDRTLVFVGLGNTAEPQPRLDDRLRRNLTAIWTAIGTAAGACTSAVEVAAAQQSVPGVPPVGVVALPQPPPPPDRCGNIVLSDQNNVGFEENTTVFRDEPAARAEIGTIVDKARNDNQRIELLGTTARYGSQDSQIDLSRRRAQRVQEIMVELGIPAARITTDGKGSYSEFYIPDGGPDNLDPGNAVQNRRVIVRLICQ